MCTEPQTPFCWFRPTGTRLKIMCAQKLRENVSVDTVGDALACAEMYSCPELRSKCVEFVVSDKKLPMTAIDRQARQHGQHDGGRRRRGKRGGGRGQRQEPDTEMISGGRSSWSFGALYVRALSAPCTAVPCPNGQGTAQGHRDGDAWRLGRGYY